MTEDAKPARRRKTPRKTAPAARKRASRKPDAGKSAEAYYESLRQGLVEDRDRDLLGRLARERLPGAPETSRAAGQAWADTLFEAVRLGAEDLISQDRQAAADLFADYITDVVPVLRTRSLDLPPVRATLQRLRLVSRISAETLSALGEDPEVVGVEASEDRSEVPASPDRTEPAKDISAIEPSGDVALVGTAADEADPAPVESAAPEPDEDDAVGPEEAPPEQAPDKAEADDREADEVDVEEPEADDAPATVATSAEIIERCLSAEQNRRKIVLLVGLPTTGKTFLVQRLKHSMRRDYTVAESKALAPRGEHGVPRTKDVLLHTFSRNRRGSSAEDFDVYDIPGDWFGRLLDDGFQNPDENRFFSLVYTIFAFADAIVFLAPAYHVLMPDAFVRHGDDDPDLQLADRRERRDQMDAFVHALDPMMVAVALLRKEMKRRMPRRPLWGEARKSARREAARAAVETVAAMDMHEIMHRRRTAGRLGIPGALLLSRADEFARRLPSDHKDMSDVFDKDPAHMLVSLGVGKEYFSHLSSRFSAFTADFLTAQENLHFTRTFRKNRPSAGVTSFFRGWLLPTITACRRPTWLRPLESPEVALGIREFLDPSFGREWNRPEWE